MNYAQRRDAITNHTMYNTALSWRASLDAGCHRDIHKITMGIATATGGDPDREFILATMYATAFCVQIGIERLKGTKVDASMVPTPPENPIFDPHTYPQRLAAATSFTAAYLRDDYDEQMRITDKHGDEVLHGLAEIVSATCPHRHTP